MCTPGGATLPLLVPLLPLLVPLLLELVVSWVVVAPWGPSPQRLSASAGCDADSGCVADWFAACGFPSFGTGAASKGIGTIGDGHLENCEEQVRRFGGSLPFFACYASNW